METSWCEDLDGQAAADAFVANRARIVAAQAREFVLCAHWADLHHPDSQQPDSQQPDSQQPDSQHPDGAGRAGGPGMASGPGIFPGMERGKALGGAGTPEVLEFATTELAVLAGVGTGTMDRMVRDALDARHRHPLLWERILQATHADDADADPAQAAAAVQVWQVRKIAYACHSKGLTREQARWVDAVTTPRLGRCNWGEFCTELEAAIIEVDPAAAAQREAAERMRRYVAKGQSNEHGLTTLVAKVEAGDAVAFLAMIDLLARVLQEDGDTGTADVRRSRAVGILANPAAALTYLLAHGYGALGEDECTEPDCTEPDCTGDRPGAEDREEDEDCPGPRGGEPTGTAPSTAGDGSPGPRAGEGQLELFADRRVHGNEGTQPPGGVPDDVPAPGRLRPRRNLGFHHPQPPPGPQQPDLQPPDSQPPGPQPPGAHPPGPPPPGPGHRADEPSADPPGRLRAADLHPAQDDSDAGAAGGCPRCGHSTAAPAPGESSARTGPAPGESPLSRPAVLLRRLVAAGVLDKVAAIDPARLLPQAVLYVHLHESSYTRDPQGVARVEAGIGPTSAETALGILGHHHVTIKPVIDLADQRPAEGYEVPGRLREALHLFRPGSVFPYAAYHGQTMHAQDADHTRPYRPVTDDSRGEPDPQTRLDNLGFLGRRHHRVKTFARGWQHRQPRLGVHLWRTRHGYWYRVDHRGTHPLGKNPDLGDHGLVGRRSGRLSGPDAPASTSAAEQRLAVVIAAHGRAHSSSAAVPAATARYPSETSR